MFTVPFAPVYDVMPETMRDIARCTDTASVVWSSDPFGTYDPRGGGQSDCADHVVTTSDEEYEAFVTAGDGSLAILSRWAYQPTTYMPGSGARKPVVTLVGQRRDLRAQICEALLAQGIPVRAHGVGWGSGRYLRFPRFLRTLQESAINLNVGSRRRVYEVTGCGGFLLTTPVEGLEESYVTDEADPANAEVALAHDIEQLVEKIRYYLAHEEEREAIAARGHRRARAEHTWSHRLAEVFEKTEWTLPGMAN